MEVQGHWEVFRAAPGGSLPLTRGHTLVLRNLLTEFVEALLYSFCNDSILVDFVARVAPYTECGGYGICVCKNSKPPRQPVLFTPDVSMAANAQRVFVVSGPPYSTDLGNVAVMLPGNYTY